jgi:hypothetical protein
MSIPLLFHAPCYEFVTNSTPLVSYTYAQYGTPAQALPTVPTLTRRRYEIWYFFT